MTNEGNHYPVEHRMERRYELSATPEQVWAAIATEEGIATWMVPTRLDPRRGGAVSFELDDGLWSNGTVTDYAENERFAYEETWAELVGQDPSSVSAMATEFLIETASGGSCVLRVVTSAFGTGAEWENEFFTEMAKHWGDLLDKLPSLVTAALGDRR